MKKILLIFLMMLFVFTACKSPTTPEPSQTSGLVEFMYERDPARPILHPNAVDPTGDAATVHNNFFGGKNTSLWQKAGEGWICWADLQYGSSWAIWTCDRKVETFYGESIGRKLSARRKGSSDPWTVLPPKPNTETGYGEMAVFDWGRIGITIPNSSEASKLKGGRS